MFLKRESPETDDCVIIKLSDCGGKIFQGITINFFQVLANPLKNNSENFFSNSCINHIFCVTSLNDKLFA